MKENKPYEHNFFYSYHVNATRKPNIEKHLTVMVIWNMNELTKKKRYYLNDARKIKPTNKIFIIYYCPEEAL